MRLVGCSWPCLATRFGRRDQTWHATRRISRDAVAFTEYLIRSGAYELPAWNLGGNCLTISSNFHHPVGWRSVCCVRCGGLREWDTWYRRSVVAARADVRRGSCGEAHGRAVVRVGKGETPPPVDLKSVRALFGGRSAQALSNAIAGRRDRWFFEKVTRNLWTQRQFPNAYEINDYADAVGCDPNEMLAAFLQAYHYLERAAPRDKK